MSNKDIERAVISGGEAVGLALENFERRVIDRFIGLLEAERKQWLDVRDMVAAVATELADSRREAQQQRGEMLAGIQGVSQQFSEYEALLPPSERLKIAEMVYRHEDELKSLLAWRASLERGGDG